MLEQEDIEKIAAALAPVLIKSVQANHHEFWLDPESHYLAHRRWDVLSKKLGDEEVYDIKNLIAMYRMTKSLWVKAFIGAALVGTTILFAVSLGFYKG